MLRKIAILAAAVLALAVTSANPASAQTLSSNATGIDQGIDDAINIIGESITPLNVRMKDFTFYLRRTTATFSVTPQIYEWDGNTVVGSALWTGPDVSITSASYSPFIFTPNLNVDVSKQYVIVVKQSFSGEQGDLDFGSANSIPGNLVGSVGAAGWVQVPMAEARFSATFDSGAVVAVPTMTELAMIMLSAILAGGAILTIQRRRMTA